MAAISASYPKTINQLKVEAMHAFHDMNEVDTLLNIIESPQLISSSRSLIKLIRDAWKQRGTRSGLGRGAAAASSGFLGWSFGLAPLLSDMNKINQALRTLKSQMDNYVRNSGRKYVVSRTCLGSIAAPGTGYTGYSSPSLNSGWWHTGVYYLHMPTLRVGVRGTRNVEYQSDAFKRLDYMLKRFIGTGPASLGWELIRFSFVLDWFVNLSGIIDSMDNALTGMSRNIDQVWMSEKWHVLVPVYKHQYGGWYSDSDGKQTALNDMSYYHREPVSADPSISLSGRFGKKQVGLTAALLHQIVADLRAYKRTFRL
jgi:hypothetical protein